jgi:hypothetical protein
LLGEGLSSILDLNKLLKLRLVVGRFGEMDLARWWNTKGQLGKLGALALRRGFPRTHYFAQARSVFMVASHRCSELFDPPGCVTLWRLPEAIEEEFEAHWEYWLDQAADWNWFFETLQTLPAEDLPAILYQLELVNSADLEAARRLRLSGKAVPLPGLFSGTDSEVAQLALAFSLGTAGELAVPYARRADL